MNAAAMMTPPPTPKIHVGTMHDSDLDALVDRYVFAENRWCTGYIDVCTRKLHCERCGYIEEPTIALKMFGSSGHPRNIPRYTASMSTAWLIVGEMNKRNEGLRLLFVHFVLEQLSSHMAPLAAMLFSLSARQVAVAALRTLGVIDTQGFIKEEGECSDANR